VYSGGRVTTRPSSNSSVRVRCVWLRRTSGLASASGGAEPDRFDLVVRGGSAIGGEEKSLNVSAATPATAAELSARTELTLLAETP